MFREGGHGVFAARKLPTGLAGTFDVALAADMVRAADMALAADMVRAADMALAVDMARAVDMVRAGGAARWGRARRFCGRQRKCGKNAVKSLTGGGRGRIFRALTRWPAARAAAAVHTEHGQRGTGGGAAVGETFTGAGAGAMTYLIFRRLHYGSI